MQYLYHKVPKKMYGDVLYPLNKLKNLYPELYELELSKYAGRESIKEHEIPYLKCKWNDVIHFTAVHPKEIKKTFLESNIRFEAHFYQIDPNHLAIEDTIIYLYKHSNPEDKLNNNNFEEFNPSKISQLSNFPEETSQYYKKMFKNSKKPLLYHKIPHILYKGNIKVKNIPIINI